MTKRFAIVCAMLAFQLPGCSVFTEPGPERYAAALRVDTARLPATNAANGSGDALFSRRRDLLDFTINVSGLSSHATAAHLHGPAASGLGDILFSFLIAPATTGGRLAGGVLSASALPGASLDPLLRMIRDGTAYVDVHTEMNPAGEIIGQIGPESKLEPSPTRVP